MTKDDGRVRQRFWAKILGWAVALGIVGLNIKLVIDQIGEWIQSSPAPAWIWATIVPMLCALGVFLLYIFVGPLFTCLKRRGFPDGADSVILFALRRTNWTWMFPLQTYRRRGGAQQHR